MAGASIRRRVFAAGLLSVVAALQGARQEASAQPAESAAHPAGEPRGRVAPSARPAALPRPAAPVRLEYAVFHGDHRKGNRVATLTQHFELDGDRYRLRSEGKANGLLALVWRGTLVQTSEGRLLEGGFAPRHYEERRGERRPRGATIDPARGQARFLDGQVAPAPAGTQDRLSVLGQLGLLVAAGRLGDAGADPSAASSVEIPLLSSSKVKSSTWRVEGSEALRVGEATVTSLRLRRVVAGDEDDPTIEAWFDPERPPWPLRVRVTEPDGSALDQVLQPGS